MRRKDEKPPEDHWRRRFPELEKELLDTYYKFKGWNDEGIPTEASLLELGLDFVCEDFIQRGILTAVEDTSSDEISAVKETN
jgi:benzoyl-CoA reductase subunit BamB